MIPSPTLRKGGFSLVLWILSGEFDRTDFVSIVGKDFMLL